MKEKYDVSIAPESEFVSYMMEQMNQFGLPCTEEQAKDFYVYYARMIETNKYLNLTGITDMKEVVVKHMIDSLSCYDSNIIKSGMSIIDIGLSLIHILIFLSVMHSYELVLLRMYSSDYCLGE